MHAVVAALTAVMLIVLASCAPGKAAVGHTETAGTAIDHDSVDRSDILIGVVGSADVSSDRQLVDAFASAGLNAFYAAAADRGNTDSAAADSGDAGSGDAGSVGPRSVDDMVGRAVKVIVINRMAMTPSHGDQWLSALRTARNAGVPVVLIDPLQTPQDTRLYAAVLTVDNDGGTIPLATIVVQVINDRPHVARARVTTVSKGANES